MPRPDHDDLKLEDMLGSWYRVSQRLSLVANQTPPEWADLDDVLQSAWSYAFQEGLRLLNGDVAEGTSIADVAAELYEAYRRIADGQVGGLPSWDEQPPPIRLHWNCLVRHLVNLLQFDPEDGETLESHEDRMGGFFEARLNDLSLTERQREIAAHTRDQAQELRQS